MTYSEATSKIKAFSYDGTLETGMRMAHNTLLDTLADVPGTKDLSNEVLTAFRLILHRRRNMQVISN